MNEDYLQQDHNDDEDDQVNIEPPKFIERPEDRDEIFERTILDLAINTELKDDRISADLEDKLEHLCSRTTNPNAEQTLRLRMNELALSKILVHTHGKHDYRLVIAHHRIGKAYLVYKCYQQAIDHITVALKKNSKLQLQGCKMYHSYLLTTLSKCYIEISSYEDALEVLTRTHEIQDNYPEENLAQAQTYRLIAICHCKSKNNRKAHDFITKALHLYGSNHLAPVREVARAKAEQAHIFHEDKHQAEAITALESAINILSQNKKQNINEIAELQQTLSQYHESNNQPQLQVSVLKQRLSLLVEMHAENHKSTLKLRRNIAMLLIKNSMLSEAIAELNLILAKEENVYGLHSSAVGKTLKMLALVHMENPNEYAQAEAYFKRAQKIMQEQGQPKLLKEIKIKLAVLKEKQDNAHDF